MTLQLVCWVRSKLFHSSLMLRRLWQHSGGKRCCLQHRLLSLCGADVQSLLAAVVAAVLVCSNSCRGKHGQLLVGAGMATEG